MNRLKTVILATLAVMVAGAIGRAQLSNVVVVDFERAVVESKEGKKASDKFNATLQAKQNEVEKKQKELEDQQRKLQNGVRTLNDAAKNELQRDIDRRTTELTRINEDGQKELQRLRDELLRPIAERATALLNAMAAEHGYTLVVDVSNPDTNVIYASEKNNITTELVKRIDASVPPESAEAPKTGAPAAPAANRPATTPATRPNPGSPTTTVAPKPNTPAPNTPAPAAPKP
jgi:outer membrane protein